MKKTGWRGPIQGTGRTGVRVFDDPKERRLAALQLYHDRMHGATYDELSKNYKVAKTTVRRLLVLATDDDLVKKIENQILTTVVPLAVKVYMQKLEQGSEFVAKDVLANFAKIADRSLKREELAQSAKEDEDSLEFLLRIKGKKKLTAPVGGQLEEEIIDGTVTDTEELTDGSGSPAIEARLEEAITEGLRADLQADGATAQGTSEISLGRSSGGFPALARRETTGGFVSVRDLIKEELENAKR